MNGGRHRSLVVAALILLGIGILLYGVGEPGLLKSAAAFAVSALMLLRAFFMTRTSG
jgi:hypothetical protein